jgi:glycosyltransferase involved in cell wall biosynthesis
MFMPSHREGFGMPVLEAGLVGIPAICTSNVPAAVEIGRDDITIFEATDDCGKLGSRLIKWLKTNPQYRFKQKIRRKYTWEAIFSQDILPLLETKP